MIVRDLSLLPTLNTASLKRGGPKRFGGFMEMPYPSSGRPNRDLMGGREKAWQATWCRPGLDLHRHAPTRAEAQPGNAVRARAARI